MECSVGQVCQVDPTTRRPVCRCGGTGPGGSGGSGPGGQCPMVYVPVCASDGHTYGNECLMRVSACQRRRHDVTVLFRDECSAGKLHLTSPHRISTEQPDCRGPVVIQFGFSMKCCMPEHTIISLPPR